MITAALVFSSIALCASAFSILVNIGIIIIKKPDTKYDKYRNEDGLLSPKRSKRND